MIAFCTTCKGRVDHIKKTLPQNLADNPGELSKFILLDYNSQDGLVEYIKENHSKELECSKLVVYSFPSPEVFHMTHAKNMAHRLGIREGASVLCNLDADNYTGSRFDAYIDDQFYRQGRVFLWAKMFTQEDGRRPRGISGRIVVTDKAFLKIGGYDERFLTWAMDDKDFHERLRWCGYYGVEIPQQNLDAILHTDKLRFKEYPHMEITGVDNEQPDPDGIIVNHGRIGMGTVFRNFDYTNPIELGPVPTRIFGIGSHKTGTTSLHTALRMLGFESAHWKNAHWAKSIWKEMRTYGRSWTVDHSYALSDLPISVLYRDLDRAYPGSKFILTVRNEGAWLKSVENHWDPKSNPHRWGWNKDPFTNKIHQEIYGRRSFDALVFLTRFRQHNNEVRDYFRDRPNDLLVMDMSNGCGWPELCSFLDRPVPTKPYPKLLVTPES